MLRDIPHGPAAKRGYPSISRLQRGFFGCLLSPRVGRTPTPCHPSGSPSPLAAGAEFPCRPQGWFLTLVPPPHGTARCGIPQTAPNPPPLTHSLSTAPSPDFPRRNEGISAPELRDNCRNGFALPDLTLFSLPTVHPLPRQPDHRHTGMAGGLFQHQLARTWAPCLNIHEPQRWSKRRTQLGSQQGWDAEIFQGKREKRRNCSAEGSEGG